jgi:two-component system chemotaxis response regulator CheY
MRVLIVDDSKTIRRLMAAAVKEMGVQEVIEAESAEEASAVLRRTPVHLVITDWHMPGNSGLDLLKEIRSNPRHKNTPVVMSTSETAGDNVVAAIQAGATNYIFKPFNRQQLQEKIGPLVKAALADEAAGRHASYTGVVGPGGIGEVIQFFVQNGKSGVCELECANCVAKIFFNRGKICGAVYQSQKGEAAFFTCFDVPIKSYRFVETEESVPTGGWVQRESQELLLEAAARFDHKRMIHG